MDRRTYLGGVGATITIGLAGCTDVLNGDDSDDPEAVVEQFFDAAADGDQEAAEALFHEEAFVPPVDEAEEDITLESTTEQSLRDVLELVQPTLGEEELDEQVEEAREELNNDVEEIGADDWTIVVAEVTFEGETEEVPYILVEDDGEWLIWQ